MKIFISEEWSVPHYDVHVDGELSPSIQAKCKEVDVLEIDLKQFIHDRNRWRDTQDRLAELFRPGVAK